jgi:hypothetical protein
MRKVKMILLAVLVLGTTSCATMFENMNVNCDDERSQADKCENFEFNLNSECE